MNRSVAPSMASGESLFNPNNIHFTTRNFSTPAYDGNGVLGIVRESYNKWERRVPLTPDQVRELVRQHDYEVIIQPSNKRIFTNKEYKAVGAKVQDDLSSACVILGVKQVEEEKLIPDKSYMFFSHTIKGQPENMSLLQSLLSSNIRFFDYECIKEPKGRRLVAFGKFAGIAGMIDTFQAVGQQLLQSGYSTPFLNSPSSYMYRDLVAAKFGISSMGRDIANGGLPTSLEPLVFAFTGKGNVAEGAREIFELLPHKWITREELDDLKKSDGPHECVYGILVEEGDMVKLKSESMEEHQARKTHDVQHYRSNPTLYEPIFHEVMAPQVNVLVNGMYWDQRYPRLLTKAQVKDLYKKNNDSFLCLADISCDIGGSVEFLEKSTTVEMPYFHYDPLTDGVSDIPMSEGISVMGVDILPSELPRESSKHFGDALMPLLHDIVAVGKGGEVGEELKGACITNNGELTENFKYIDQLKRDYFKAQVKIDREQDVTSLMFELDGHLFDSGLINHVLDLIESNECSMEIVECNVGSRDAKGTTQAVLKVSHTDLSVEELRVVAKKVQDLVELLPTAEATIKVYGDNAQKPTHTTAKVTDLNQKQVLLLGSGKVAISFAEYIGRRDDRKVVVCGNVEKEVADVKSYAKHGEGVVFDVVGDKEKLKGLVADSDIVVSLLPAPFHPMVGEMAIENNINMVTASYVSDGIQELDGRLKEKGLRILNEVGLDPGMDHMSAMKIMDDIKARGGKISHFESVCGGLPAPEAAANPLMYKFSWSPMGVLTASQNDAIYLRDGNEISIVGSELLNNTDNLYAFPTMNLECLANRNSLIYKDLYDIPDADTVFRGTIRFRGFSDQMYAIKKMGLLEDVRCEGSGEWREVIAGMNIPGEARAFMHWLGVEKEGLMVSDRDSIIKSFCSLLEDKMTLGKEERDMVLMNHDIRGEFSDGTIEKHQSSLQLFGEGKGGMTAMCKTVGYTAAVGTEMVLDGSITDTGVLTPMDKSVYERGLELLEKEGLIFEESCVIEER